MTLKISVLFIAAEAEPFIKVGGLGDVAGALPLALNSLQAHIKEDIQLDIRLAIPFHSLISADRYNLTSIGSFPVNRTNEQIIAQVYSTQLSDLTVYLIKGPPLADGLPVYSLDARSDGEKFVFFSLASLELCRYLGWSPNILHANDWHTAPAVYALTRMRSEDPFFEHTHSVLSLHNLPFMGQGAQEALTAYGLPPTTTANLPDWARHLPLPLGLLSADRIVPVSPTYAREILTPEFGCGLQDFLASRNEVIIGILNGLDTDAWNPASDPNIRTCFTSQNLSNRTANKLDLLSEFSLEQDPAIPLLALVSRMDPQKGVDIALDGLRLLPNMNWQAIILGTGVHYLEESARMLESAMPQRVRAAIRFDARLSHQIYAGADIFMMPSRYEPCGLAQMAAMRYGCIPVASAAGGLVDSVFDDPSQSTNTGFLFSPATPHAFAQAIARALDAYQDQIAWRKLQGNGMARDYSWETSAQAYLNLYRKLMEDMR
jgi:starch synthase